MIACEQKRGGGGCHELAVSGFIWPGMAEARPICARCLAWARRVAEAMGFVLPVTDLADIIRHRAADTVARLGGTT